MILSVNDRWLFVPCTFAIKKEQLTVQQCTCTSTFRMNVWTVQRPLLYTVYSHIAPMYGSRTSTCMFCTIYVQNEWSYLFSEISEYLYNVYSELSKVYHLQYIWILCVAQLTLYISSWKIWSFDTDI